MPAVDPVQDVADEAVQVNPRTTVTGAGRRFDDPTRSVYSESTAPAAPVTNTSSLRAQPRRVRLRVTRVGPGTVAQVTFLLAAVFAVASLIGVTISWLLLDLSGTLSGSQNLANAIFGTTTTTIDLGKVLSLPKILLITAVFEVFQVVMLTFMAWLLALAYNSVVRLTGGIEVTLADH